MSTDITDADFVARSTSEALTNEEAALHEAEARAIAEINRIKAEVAAKGNNLSPVDDYELYDVPEVGRYVIMRDRGWKPLVNIIGNDHDQRSIVANIDFSPKLYPTFDAIIGDHFQSPYLLDPADDKFMSYKSLRDNLAAVRNFLVESYFAHTPEGMTDAKARSALKEIAAFVGDGLYNNWLFGGVIPNHDPRKPFIDLDHARKPGGEGAQYIYKKILEQQRQSSWLKPFDAVLAFFGGHKRPDWHLPPAEATGFNHAHLALSGVDGASLKSQLATATGALSDINARLSDVHDRRLLNDVAGDLDAMGNQLAYTAMHMEKGVAQLSEPVRRDAVEIALEILRKLKVGIGDKNLIDGLKMKPTDDVAALGAIKGVALVYERLLAWARANNDAGVLQNPAVLAATQAIGQLGYQAKREAMRMAALSKNSALVEAIGEQIARMPKPYTSTSDGNFGALFDKITSGMTVILNRTQQVTVGGAKVGHSLERAGNNMMSAPPTAGIAAQVNAAQGMQRNAQIIAEQQAAQTMARGLQQHHTEEQKRQQQAIPAAAQPAPRGSSGVGRQPFAVAQTAKTERRAQTAKAANVAAARPIAPNPALQQLAARQAAYASSMHHLEELHHHDEQLHREQQRLYQLQQQQKMAAKQAAKAQAAAAAARAAQTIPKDMLQGFKMATDASKLTTPPITGGKAIDPKSIRQSMAAKTSETTKPDMATVAQSAPVSAAPSLDPELDKYKQPIPGGAPQHRNGPGGRGF